VAPVTSLPVSRSQVSLGPIDVWASFGGYAFSAVILVLAVPLLGPGGDVVRLFDPIGDAFRAGQPIYAPAQTPFFYAPPWALFLGAVSWLPVPLTLAAVWALNLAGLRVMAGSWLAVGWLAWFPLVSLSLLGATFNLAMAAAIYAGAVGGRGSTPAAVAMAFAKVSPILVVDPRRWRSVLALSLVLVAVTLPWLSLWREWAEQLLRYAGTGVGPTIPVPFVLRLAIAVPVWFVGRPWARALAAVLAVPAFYWESLVLFIAPLCLYFRRHEAPVAAVRPVTLRLPTLRRRPA